MEELSWLYSVSISSLILLSIIFLVNLGRKRHLPPPPSPPSIPLIGHLHLIKRDVPFHQTLQALSLEYGHVFRLKLGLRYAVVVSSPAAVEECLVKNDAVLANRPPSRSAKHLNYDATTISNVSYGDHYRYLRKLLNVEVFSVSRQNTFLSFRREEVKILVKSLFNKTKEGLERVELLPGLNNLTLNGILRMASGKRYYGEGADDSNEGTELRKRVKERMGLSVAMSNPADFFPFLRWIDYMSYEKKLLKLRDQMDEVLQGLVDEHRRNMKEARLPTKSLIDNLLAIQEADPASITDETIKGIILVMITAGTDSSSITMEWAMSLLVNNPEKLKKARDEIDTAVGSDRLVDESDLPNLPYIQGIVSEALRIYPSTPLLLPHHASADCTIQGFYVKRGTMVLVNAYALHRDPEVWDDPMSFKPERFKNIRDNNHEYKFIPFGVGRRMCPGQGLAQKVVGLAVASLIQCFDWERVMEEEVDMCEIPGLTMSKAKPLQAMCRPRDKMLYVLSAL